MGVEVLERTINKAIVELRKESRRKSLYTINLVPKEPIASINLGDNGVIDKELSDNFILIDIE